VRTVTSLMKIYTIKLVYFAYFSSLGFHSCSLMHTFPYFQAIMLYRVIFWGNSTDSKKVFNIQ
jgi:hypothetical protein